MIHFTHNTGTGTGTGTGAHGTFDRQVKSHSGEVDAGPSQLIDAAMITDVSGPDVVDRPWRRGSHPHLGAVVPDGRTSTTHRRRRTT